MNCIVCHRTMKNHSDTGAGPVCSRKLRGGEVSVKAVVRVELIYRQLRNEVDHRRYLVFTDPREVITTSTSPSGEHYIGCRRPSCAKHCEHVQAVIAYLLEVK